MSARLSTALWRVRYWVSGLVLAGAAAFLPLANFVELDNDITAWFSRSDPVFLEYERLRKEFGGSRTLIVAIEGDGLFTPRGLSFLRDVTRDIERVPAVDRVQSLASATVVQSLAGPDGGIEVTALVPDAIDESAAAAVRARALGDRLLRGDLISEDGRVAAIIVSFNEDRIDEIRGWAIDRVHALVDPKLPPGLTAYYNGSLEISETYDRVTIANTTQLTPAIFLCMLVGIWILFRSIPRTLLAFVAIMTSVLWTMGLFRLLGFSYNVLTSMVPALVVVLAVADDIHIIQHFDLAMREHGNRERAFRSTIEHLFAPLLGASVTTALGLASLATSNVASVREFGLASALGVMVDFVLSLAYVPTLLLFVPAQVAAPPQERWLMLPLGRTARRAMRSRGVVLAASAGILVVAAAGVLRLQVDTNHIHFFPESHPLHRSAVLIDRQLAGVYSFQVFLEGPPDSMKSPDTLARMERLDADLRTLAAVRKVTSLADYVKRVNRELNGGGAEAEVVPASADAIAQELFVFALSDAGRIELERVAASDFSRSQISVKMAAISSDAVFREIERAREMAGRAFEGSGITPTVTGSGRLFSALDHYLVVSQISSFATAFVTVFGVIFLVFRSTRFGLLAIVANVFPVVVVLGFMGWTGISLNVATIMVASVTLGIVDDDTIHFINRYRHEAGRGVSTELAVETAASHEGRASLTTALINTAGYAILAASEYKPTAWFGGLLALTMGVAFLAEVLIVPAVIAAFPGIYGTDRIAARLSSRR